MKKVKIKKIAPLALSIISSIGVIGVGVTTAKSTVKAVKILKQVEDEKEDCSELTKADKVRLLAPTYIPPVIVALCTISCIMSAHVLNKKQQAVLIGAYTALNSTYKEYSRKIRERYGDETDLEIKKEIIKDEFERDMDKFNVGHSDSELFYDEYTSAYFEAPLERVLEAERQFNNAINEFGCVNVGFLYDLINVDNLYYMDYGLDAQITDPVEFEHYKAYINDDLECTIVRMNNFNYA